MIFRIILVLIFFLIQLKAFALCPQADIISTMISRVSWKCLFPLRIGSVTVKPGGEDTPPLDNEFFCQCYGEWGVRMSFWEPIRLIEVVRQPYCFPALNTCLTDTAKNPTPSQLKKHGTDTWGRGDMSNEFAFYHVHYYVFPIWRLLGIGVAIMGKGLDTVTGGIYPDFSKCFSGGGSEGLTIDSIDSLDIFILTELDPTWNDDLIAAYMNPEAVLFGNPISQAVCAADCIGATSAFPLDPLFWCAGCWGGIYPFTGTVPYSNGGIESSSLLSAKMVAKLNRMLLEGVTTVDYCRTIPTGFIKKSQYKLQLLYPRVSKQCFPLGKSTMVWGTGKTYPEKGEDFVYLLWRKKECCAR